VAFAPAVADSDPLSKNRSISIGNGIPSVLFFSMAMFPMVCSSRSCIAPRVVSMTVATFAASQWSRCGP
jgi:hypothetical protein